MAKETKKLPQHAILSELCYQPNILSECLQYSNDLINLNFPHNLDAFLEPNIELIIKSLV